MISVDLSNPIFPISLSTTFIALLFIVWALLGDYITATVIGIAGMTFLTGGIAGFYKVDMPAMGQLLLFTGTTLLVLGVYVMNLAGWAMESLFALGLAVLLFSAACWAGGSAVLEKIGAVVGGGTVLTVCD